MFAKNNQASSPEVFAKHWQDQIARWTLRACQMEVLSPKPGNVSPGREFEDSSVNDFLVSAWAISSEMRLAESRPLGETILRCAAATRAVVSHNTNLGIILLVAPLAAVPSGRSLREGISEVLRTTTVADSVQAYRAIRLVQPSGLGEVRDQDLHEDPTLPLLECMRLAADRDLIAAQYVSGFRDVLDSGLQWLRESARYSSSQQGRICWLAVRLMAEFGDSLIARKCGTQISEAVQHRARALLHSGWPSDSETFTLFEELDTFLRADGNRRNPGTTADMVAAILFASLREGQFVADESWSFTGDPTS